MSVKLVYGVEWLVGLLAGNESEVKDAGERRVEFNFPVLTVRTKLFAGIFDRLGALRFSRLVSWWLWWLCQLWLGLGFIWLAVVFLLC